MKFNKRHNFSRLMNSEISEEIVNEILKLISIPGVDIEDIEKKVNLDCDTILKILEEEYTKKDLNYGSRLCCKF